MISGYGEAEVKFYLYSFRTEKMVKNLNVDVIDDGKELEAWFYVDAYGRKEYFGCWPYKRLGKTVREALHVIEDVFDKKCYRLYIECLRKTAVIDNGLSVIQSFRELLEEYCEVPFEIDTENDVKCDDCEECSHQEFCNPD